MTRLELYRWVFRVFPTWVRLHWFKLLIKIGLRAWVQPKKVSPKRVIGLPCYYYYKNKKKRGVGKVTGYSKARGFEIQTDIPNKVLHKHKIYALDRERKLEILIYEPVFQTL